MSESLNSGPLPGSGIDCRVQRMALALRYHYSSIDRPALKSKSHLVAQAIVSGSGDNEVCLCVGGGLGVCVHVQVLRIFLVSLVFGVFQGCSLPLSHSLSTNSLSQHSSHFLSLSPPPLLWIKVRNESQCVFHVSKQGVWTHL